MKYGWLLILFFASCFAVFAQNSSKVKELERQRKKALQDIALTSQLLDQTQTSAKNSLERLNLLTQQILSRKKLISILNQEMHSIDQQIATINQEIALLNKDLKNKQQNYSKSAKSMYKRRSSQDKLLFVLSAENFGQSLRRMRYLREYAEWQKKQAESIIAKQKEIKDQQVRLAQTRKEKEALLDARELESKQLQQEETSQKEEVNQLSKKQKDLQASLKKKKQQAENLNRQIEKQIAYEIAQAEAKARAERERIAQAARKKAAAAQDKQQPKEAEKEAVLQPEAEQRVAESQGGYAMTKEEKKLSGDFAKNKGALPFPVSGRYTIVGRFGEQQHPQLKYVRTNNNGIDLQVQPGTDARAVFGGEVTSLFVVPGYNNSVIVRHGNYLTVYCNLSKVYVKKGDRIATRQAIGQVYTDKENGNTTILHFELRKEKTKLNPLQWLN